MPWVGVTVNGAGVGVDDVVFCCIRPRLVGGGWVDNETNNHLRMSTIDVGTWILLVVLLVCLARDRFVAPNVVASASEAKHVDDHVSNNADDDDEHECWCHECAYYPRRFSDDLY
jgi:hypothetical protein